MFMHTAKFSVTLAVRRDKSVVFPRTTLRPNPRARHPPRMAQSDRALTPSSLHSPCPCTSSSSSTTISTSKLDTRKSFKLPKSGKHSASLQSLSILQRGIQVNRVTPMTSQDSVCSTSAGVGRRASRLKFGTISRALFGSSCRVKCVIVSEKSNLTQGI